MIVDLPEPIAVVCHDAGAANLILAWLANEKHEIRPVMQGPALALWQERFGEAPTLSLDAALDGAASVLSGTGWASDLEHLARQRAARLGLPSAAVIDHWVNYAPRFERRGAVQLPDRIWVCDQHAEAIAKGAFPVRIELKPNAYLAEQAALIGPAPAQGDVLYLCEPIRDPWRSGEASEFAALDYFIAQRGHAGIADDVPIRLRLHPSEPPDKYGEWIAAQHGSDVRIDPAASLAAAIQSAAWVVGCQTFGLVVALATGRRAISVLPPWAPPLALPQSEIVCLRDFDPGSFRLQSQQGCD